MSTTHSESSKSSTVRVGKSDAEYREQMNATTYHITREKGTEAAFSGKYWDLKDRGMYNCAACGESVFSSESKYDSGSGWPSFYQPTNSTSITEHTDDSHGMVRTEVVCSHCDSHLGHVFPDGPPETGLRYCINSASLNFEKAEE